MSTILGLNCATSQKGTGVISCEVPTDEPTGMVKVKKSWRFDPATETFNDAYIKSKIKDKTFIPILDAIGYEDTSEDNQTITTSTGVILPSRDGKPSFSLEYHKGYAFHAAVWSYGGFGNYDVIFTFANGVWFLASTVDGSQLKGHTAGLFDVNGFRINSGDTKNTKVNVQLLNPREYNTNGVLLHDETNGFDTGNVRPIIDTKITNVSNNVADVVVKVRMQANELTSLEGLVVGQFRATGTSETISSINYDSVNKQYTLTFSGDVSGDYSGLVIDLYDTGDSTTVVDVSDQLYQAA